MFSKGLVRGLLIAGGFGVAVAAYGAFQILTSGHSLKGLLPVVASFACFGLLLGAVHTFDGLSEFALTDRPLFRTALSATAGLSLSLVWHWSSEATALAVLVAGALGLFGMLWARFVDF